MGVKSYSRPLFPKVGVVDPTDPLQLTECVLQDEVDHKDDGDEEQIDLVSKAEKEFFECIEAEKKRRERDHSGKDQDLSLIHI